MPREHHIEVEGLEFCCTVAPAPQMLDYNGHLNIAFYGALFEDAARSIFSRLDLSKSYRERSDCALFAAEMHSVFHREVLEGEAVSICWRLMDFDGSKIHCMFFMVKTRDQILAAVQEILYLHVDLQARRVGAIPEPQASRLGELLRKHGALPVPADAGRRVGMRQGRRAPAPRGAKR